MQKHGTGMISIRHIQAWPSIHWGSLPDALVDTGNTSSVLKEHKWICYKVKKNPGVSTGQNFEFDAEAGVELHRIYQLL